jgi:hypothetical protein
MLYKPLKVQSAQAPAIPLVTPGTLLANLFHAALIFWLLLGYALWPQFQTSWRLFQRGALATATVTTVVLQRADDGPSYRLCYAYQPDSASAVGTRPRIEHCEEIEWTVGQVPGVGASVSVRYVSDAPQIVSLVASASPPAELLLEYLRVFALILVVLGFLTIFPALPLLRQSAHLVREGRISHGEIVDCGVSRVGKKSYYIAYAFPGSPVMCQEVDARRFRDAKIGDLVKVRFLPANPRFSRIEWS